MIVFSELGTIPRRKGICTRELRMHQRKVRAIQHVIEIMGNCILGVEIAMTP